MAAKRVKELVGGREVEAPEAAKCKEDEDIEAKVEALENIVAQAKKLDDPRWLEQSGTRLAEARKLLHSRKDPRQ